MKKGTLGHMIHMARFEKGMSQKTLAGLIRVDPSYISSLENGRTSMPSEEVLQRIAEALDLNFQKLLNLNSGASFPIAKVAHLKIEEPKVIATLNSLLDQRVFQDQLEAVTLYLGPSDNPSCSEECYEIHFFRLMNQWLLSGYSPTSMRGKRLRMVAKNKPVLQRQHSTYEPDLVIEEEDQ